MSTTATLVQLAAELTVFLVAVAGVGLSLRTGLLGLDRSARLLLLAGFATVAGAAFAVGSLGVERTDEPVSLAAVRIGGAALVALGALRWAGSRAGRLLLLGGLGVFVAAAVVESAGIDVGAEAVGAEPLVLLSGLVMGAALVVAGRHTIPGRIGTSVAGVLLVVVLLVSVALSTVISTTVEDAALARYGSRATAEAAATAAAAEGAVDVGNLVAAALGARTGAELALLAGVGPGGADDPAARAARRQVQVALGALAGPDGLDLEDPVLVVNARGGPEAAVPEDLGPALRLALGGDAVVGEALAADGPRQGVAVVGDLAFALAAVPVRVVEDGARRSVGAVLVARPLDDSFLERRPETGEPLSFALVARDRVIATAGPQPPVALLEERGRAVIDADGAADGAVGESFVVARAVATPEAAPQLALVVSAPTEPVSRTREDIYRSLFLVALAAGLVGIAFAVLVGERIGGAIRRLTAAAARIREGDLAARAAVDREDELGELSATFDAMAASVLALTDDLRRSAATEAGLRSRLESVFSGVAEAVVAADEDRRVTDVNRAAVDLLGLADAADAVGRPLDEVVRVAGLDGYPVAFSAARDRPRMLAGSVLPAGPARAEPVPVVGTVAALRLGDGRRAGLVVVLRDMRRDRALEEAKQQFLANIGHELRTPLTPIKGYAGLLRRRAPTADQAHEWADGIAAGVDRLEHLVDRLVTFAALTAGPPGAAGGIGAGREVVDPAAVGRDAVAAWQRRLGPGRPVVLDVDDGAGPVSGVAAHLRLAVGELIDNAARFSPAGAPVRVAVARVPPDGAGSGPALVAFSVGDEGSGGEGLADLVGVFAQGDASATRAHDGLGLGLALVDRIARAHGGRVAIAADPARAGTTVSILVPVVVRDAGPPAGDGPVGEDRPPDESER